MTQTNTQNMYFLFTALLNEEIFELNVFGPRNISEETYDFRLICPYICLLSASDLFLQAMLNQISWILVYNFFRVK